MVLFLLRCCMHPLAWSLVLQEPICVRRREGAQSTRVISRRLAFASTIDVLSSCYLRFLLPGCRRIVRYNEKWSVRVDMVSIMVLGNLF